MTRKLVLVISLLLAACSPFNKMEKEADAIVTEDQSMDRQIIELLSDRIFLYNLSLKNKNIKEIELTVEYFQDGQKIGEEQSFSGFADQIKEHKLAFIQHEIPRRGDKWTLSILNHDGYSALSFDQEFDDLEFDSMSGAWGSVSLPLYLTRGEKTILAYVIHTSQNQISTPGSFNFSEDFQNLISQEHVYVLSVTLK